jgi:hypothetical protein
MEVSGKGRKTRLPMLRLWIEVALAALAAAMALLTIAWPEWIEGILGIEPDGGNGTLEWGFVAASGLASLTLSLLARANWASRVEVAENEEVSLQR